MLSISEFFGSKLRHHRKKEKYTQEALAQKLKISVRHLQNLEAGAAEPSLSFAISLAQVFQLDIRSFLPQSVFFEESHHIIDELHEGIQIIDVKGNIIGCNQAHANMLGLKKNELLGKNITEIVANEDEKKGLQDYINFLVEKKPSPTPYLTTHKHQNGSLIPLKIMWDYLFDETGEVIAFFSIIRKDES